MTTYNTGNPLGSAAAKDLYDNAENLDHLSLDTVNEMWPDRMGKQRITWYGIEKKADRAISEYGYITKDSFEDGSTLSLANECLRFEATGEYYRWDGDFPKVVPPGSTPDSTGGVGAKKWISVGFAALKDALGRKDGFKFIGECLSMAELRSVVPEIDGQPILLRGYYANQPYASSLIYDWYASSTETDDGGLCIKVNTLTTGRFKLRQNGSRVYDCRIWGMIPNKTYSDTQQNIKPMLDKAMAAIGSNGVLNFALPDGWTEAHYLNDYLGQIFTASWISADAGVILHSPFTSDNYGDKPRLASQITFSEIAPSNIAGNGTQQQRDANNYALMDAVGAAMGAPYATMLDRFERLFFTTGSRGVRISNLASNGITADATGMTIGTQAVLWSNAAAAGNDWQGIELGCSCGSEIDLILRNTSGDASGTVIIGARMLSNYGTSGGVLNYRLTIGSDGVSIYNGNTLARTYSTWHPEDQIQANNGSIRVGLRISA
ncbi:TPA: hypothetical protein JHJ69_004458, partial [Enterobacter cloacae]|nr:hypothetical protein [Enterobacter cloacae]HBB9956583.1 hypothetical protein [Enterobacter cloacae]